MARIARGSRLSGGWATASRRWIGEEKTSSVTPSTAETPSARPFGTGTGAGAPGPAIGFAAGLGLAFCFAFGFALALESALAFGTALGGGGAVLGSTFVASAGMAAGSADVAVAASGSSPTSGNSSEAEYSASSGSYQSGSADLSCMDHGTCDERGGGEASGKGGGLLFLGVGMAFATGTRVSSAKREDTPRSGMPTLGTKEPKPGSESKIDTWQQLLTCLPLTSRKLV